MAKNVIVPKLPKVISPPWKKWNKKLTLVGIVLDKSGSMLSIKKQAIDGFNEQLDELKDRVTDTHVIKVTTTLFGSTIEKQTSLKDAEDVLPMTAKSYRPSGMTAMYDAVGETIRALQEYHVPVGTNVAYLLVIVSDGMENYSKEYNSSSIRQLVTQCQDTGKWTFVYIGANQDLSKVSESLNIPILNTMSFEANPHGYRIASAENVSALSSYLDGRKAGVTRNTDFFSKGNRKK